MRIETSVRSASPFGKRTTLDGLPEKMRASRKRARNEIETESHGRK
jgi:hypothetical protein